jgi:flavin-dependent dehydrogenase
MIDAVVVGGGPIGLAAALYLDRLGLQVMVLEQRAAPIDKACGEGLMPAAVAALNDLGVRPAGRDFAGIRYLDGRRSVAAHFTGPAGRGVRRTELQSALHSAVLQRQIPIELCRVDAVAQNADSVLVGGVRARYLVAADGLHSPIREQLGMRRAPRRRARWGLRLHYSVAPWSDLVEVHWNDTTEAYVTPTGPGEVGVAVLSSLRVPFEQHLAGFPQLRERLQASPSGAVRGAGPLRQRVRRRVAGRVALVGDAAGYVDALTGEGLSTGLACARRLADCLARDRPEDYERLWRQATRRHRLLTEALLLASGNRTSRRLIVPGAARLPRAFAAVVNQLAG